MTLFQKKQKRKRLYQNKLKKKKNEVRLPRVFEKFLLMIQLFGSTDVARMIIEMVQQMNREDTIEFRELNNAMILTYDYIYNYNYIEYKSVYYITNYSKNTRKKDSKHTLTKHEHKLRKSFHKHENKRRNKMIKNY